MTPSQTSGEPRFRPDLEGLRGVAVLLVVLCHVQMPGVGAGFVGVDVFFVLSGFLITGLLIEDRERSGRIRLGAFYARRIRRILPAAVVVLAGTLLAAELLLSPLDVPRVAEDGLAAILSLSNIRYALEATDYFAATDPSPLLHYWSLAVEEQFYLLWPLLLLVVARLGRPRVSMTILAVSVLIGSFILSVAVTSTSGPWAYYSLPTRAWELAAGGLLALAAPWYRWMRGPLAAATGWAGVGLLLVGLATIDATTGYPGVAALLPTLGAVAIIASGAGTGSPGAIVLALTPLRWLGRISYSLYLWHWPILVLGPVALGLEATEEGAGGADLPVRLGLVMLAVAAAALTWFFVEQPFRRARLAPVRGRRGFALAGAMALTVVVGSTTMSFAAAREVDAVSDLDPVALLDGDAEVLPSNPTDDAPRDVPTDDDPETEVAPPSALPPPEATPGAPEAPAEATDPPARPRPKARNSGPVPRDLDPSLGKARRDEDRLAARGCGLALSGSRPPKCVFGDPDGDVTVALVGDSHAAQWFPAFEVLAKRHGWRLVPFTKFSCVFVDLPIWSDHLKREYTECESWRENVVDRLVDLEPDLVVIASARWFPVIADNDEDPGRQGVGMARLIKRIPGTVAIMMDTPRSAHDVPACLARHRDAIQACATSRAEAFGWRHRRREKAAAKLSGASLVDLSKATCPADPCPPIIGTKLVYRDHHHLTRSFVVTLVDEIEAALPAFGPGSGS